MFPYLLWDRLLHLSGLHAAALAVRWASTVHPQGFDVAGLSFTYVDDDVDEYHDEVDAVVHAVVDADVDDDDVDDVDDEEEDRESEHHTGNHRRVTVQAMHIRGLQEIQNLGVPANPPSTNFVQTGFHICKSWKSIFIWRWVINCVSKNMHNDF